MRVCYVKLILRQTMEKDNPNRENSVENFQFRGNALKEGKSSGKAPLGAGRMRPGFGAGGRVAADGVLPKEKRRAKRLD